MSLKLGENEKTCFCGEMLLDQLGAALAPMFWEWVFRRFDGTVLGDLLDVGPDAWLDRLFH